VGTVGRNTFTPVSKHDIHWTDVHETHTLCALSCTDCYPIGQQI